MKDFQFCGKLFMIPIIARQFYPKNKSPKQTKRPFSFTAHTRLESESFLLPTLRPVTKTEIRGATKLVALNLIMGISGAQAPKHHQPPKETKA